MTIAGAAREAVLAHAREAAPNECCGLLVGQGTRILAAVRARNLENSPTRFLLDPSDHVAARREARARGWDIVGFYHSHPRTRAAPSASDVAEALYDEAIYLIAGWCEGEAELRAFTIANGVAAEQTVIVE